MRKVKVEITNAPRPRGAYSTAIRCGDFIYVAGQSARDRDLNVVGDTIEAQTCRTIENLDQILREAHSSLDEVVKATVHLSDLSMFERYDRVYAEMMPEPRPVRTTVGSILAPGVMIEIDVVAYAASLGGPAR
jgi:reactive intermediate/imine deaminase